MRQWPGRVDRSTHGKSLRNSELGQAFVDRPTAPRSSMRLARSRIACQNPRAEKMRSAEAAEYQSTARGFGVFPPGRAKPRAPSRGIAPLHDWPIWPKLVGQPAPSTKSPDPKAVHEMRDARVFRHGRRGEAR